MRQLVAFLERIHVRTTKKEYYRAALLCKLHHAEIAPLAEILRVGSSQGFDESTDRFLMERAQKRLEEQQRERRA